MQIFGKQSFIKLFFNRLILRIRGINPDNLHELLKVQDYLENNDRTDFNFSMVFEGVDKCLNEKTNK